MLADPEIRESLAVIVANAPTLAALASMGTALLQRGPEIADNINGMVRQLRESTDDSGRGGQPARRRHARWPSSRRWPSTLADAQGHDPGLPRLADPAARDRRGRRQPSARRPSRPTSAPRGRQVDVGSVFALHKILKDPDVQETLAFFVEFARVFGAQQRSA